MSWFTELEVSTYNLFHRFLPPLTASSLERDKGEPIHIAKVKEEQKKKENPKPYA